jgi:hypothetical protein
MGLRSGWCPLDQHLFEQGLPCPGLSLWVAPPGLGATQLWIKTYEELRKQQAWSLWIETQTQLCPQQLWRQGVVTDFLFVIRQYQHSCRLSKNGTPTGPPLIKLIKEAMSFNSFSLIGMELSELSTLASDSKQGLLRTLSPSRNFSQNKKIQPSTLHTLKRLCKDHLCSLVLISTSTKDLKHSAFFDLALEFQSRCIHIHRAKNRPSQSIPWSHPYGAFLSAPPTILTPRAG